MILNLGMTDRTKQHGIISCQLIQEIRGGHSLVFKIVIGSPGKPCPSQLIARFGDSRLGNTNGLFGHFGTNAITSNDCNPKFCRHESALISPLVRQKGIRGEDRQIKNPVARATGF